MDSRQEYKVIGLMSGTSLDGLDIAFCSFTRKEERWLFKIKHAETIPYTSSWLKNLQCAHQRTAEELLALDSAYGKYLGNAVENFKMKYKIRNADFIASHGHTIFHQPSRGFTFQLGDGQALHAVTKLPVVCDFRTLDVMLRGQGAPLVPVGDKFLFGEYDACLNLGGIANISMEVQQRRTAFDICFVNMGLNYLAGQLKKKYDKDGKLAAAGAVNQKLVSKLEGIYRKLLVRRPSLGREFFENHVQPVLDAAPCTVHDKLCSFTEVAVKEIAHVIKQAAVRSVLCTGGGAFNRYFMYRLIEHTGDDTTLIIPDEQVVKFKEALVFAFLGVLRVEGKVNALKSVTGASRDSCGGILIGSVT